jgi:hypothetical protein
MEVASPLTFGSAGAKRHYPGSPGFVDTNHPFAMIDSAAEEYVPQRAFKRRRFLADECMDESENTQNHSSFPVNSIIPRSSFSSSPFQGKLILDTQFHSWCSLPCFPESVSSNHSLWLAVSPDCPIDVVD